MIMIASNLKGGIGRVKLTVLEEATRDEIEVVIHCRSMDSAVAQVIACLSRLEHKLVGTREGKSFVLELRDVFYCESVDRHTFLYTRNEVYETPLKLYELEERLEGSSFFRASKSVILNLSHIQAFRSNPLGGGKIEVTLENDERLFVSRAYVPLLKGKLGM